MKSCVDSESIGTQVSAGRQIATSVKGRIICSQINLPLRFLACVRKAHQDRQFYNKCSSLMIWNLSSVFYDFGQTRIENHFDVADIHHGILPIINMSNSQCGGLDPHRAVHVMPPS